MQKNSWAVSENIFSPIYWKMASQEKSKTHIMALMALMIALEGAMSTFFIPVGENLRIYFSFITTSISCLIGGPIMGLCYGFISNHISFFLHPSGPYFPGYVLSAMAAGFLYGLFLYRQKITVLRLFICKLTINVFVNVLLGSIWSAVLMGKGYYYYLAKSIVKNIVMLPVETLLLVSVLQIVLPILSKKGIIYNGGNKKIPMF